MIDINKEFSFEEQCIVHTFPHKGVEFNGDAYLKDKRSYNKLLSGGILFVADKQIGYENPFIHLTLAGQILQQHLIWRNIQGVLDRPSKFDLNVITGKFDRTVSALIKELDLDGKSCK
jgi:hypothetical protein|nr:MAG TPA: hypothetical protein [Caudoviricetes sp.]